MELQKLIEILLELKSGSSFVKLNPTEGNLRAVMDKYNMLFVGEDFNCIYSNELAHAIKNYFKIEISVDELNDLVPGACSSLNMKFEPMVAVKDISKANRKISCYQITL